MKRYNFTYRKDIRRKSALERLKGTKQALKGIKGRRMRQHRDVLKQVIKNTTKNLKDKAL